MGKKSRAKSTPVGSSSVAEAGAIGPRQPCPCGSGKRYKACHGGPSGGSAFVARPFEGLWGECDLVAMRELVPSATTPVKLKDSDRQVLLCSLLPGAAPALVRADGTIWLGLQVQHNFGDPSRDIAAVLETALDTQPGQIVGLTADPGPGPRLQDLIDDGPFEVTVHDGFDYWLEDVESSASALAALDQANSGALPSKRLNGLTPASGAAYWTSVGTKEHLRWVMPYDEDRLLDALARLHAAGDDGLVEGSRFVGMFRAYGLLAPVWDLPVGTGADVLEEPAARFAIDLEAALETTAELTSEHRAARAGLANRQVTLR